MAKAHHTRFDCSPGCSVEAAIGLIDGKWKSVILFHLLDGTLRFNEIRRQIPAVTQRMLTNQLRELEADGLITRKVYAQVPPKVEYSLSPLGLTIKPILTALKAGATRISGSTASRNRPRPMCRRRRFRPERGPDLLRTSYGDYRRETGSAGARR